MTQSNGISLYDRSAGGEPPAGAVPRFPGGCVSVTVADLLAMPRLNLTLLGGGAGRGRTISWAHPSDLDHPWDWLTGGELVLRNGETLPVERAEQLAYLRRLAENGAAGLVIGADPRTP